MKLNRVEGEKEVASAVLYNNTNTKFQIVRERMNMLRRGADA